MLKKMKVLFALALVAIASLGVTGVVVADPGLSARGGGIVGGDPGLEFGSSRSQFGFTASADGGQFQCLMAGQSGGFSLPDGTTVLLMNVHGSVAPGSLEVKEVSDYEIHDLTVSGLLATFSGVSTVMIEGRAPDGSIVKIAMELPYEAEALAGGAGTAVLHLHHPDLGLHTGGVVEQGRIDVSE
ncbi:MAG: hypothetical protein HYX78_10990 [Armatimonadetes bacterium]|nr:hypothetical protein [Armatimonadota bacterium]